MIQERSEAKLCGLFFLCCCLSKFLFAFSRIYISCCRNDMSSVEFFLHRFYVAKKSFYFISEFTVAHSMRKEENEPKTFDMSEKQKPFD